MLSGGYIRLYSNMKDNEHRLHISWPRHYGSHSDKFDIAVLMPDRKPLAGIRRLFATYILLDCILANGKMKDGINSST